MKYKLILTLSSTLLLSTCQSQPAEPAAEAAAEPEAPVEWQVLFDGSETHGLRGFRQDEFPSETWKIVDGTLQAVPGRGVDLITDEQFTDFDLEFEWKVPPGGNSGVMYRVAEAGTEGATYMSGPEYQVLDDDVHPDGKDPKTSAGSLYALIAPEGKPLKPVGEFNTGRIVFQDTQVEHWLNGKKVVSYEWYSDDVQARIAESKFAAWPEFMKQDTGHIAFQHHGEEVWYRNIRVRRLGP